MTCSRKQRVIFVSRESLILFLARHLQTLTPSCIWGHDVPIGILLTCTPRSALCEPSLLKPTEFHYRSMRSPLE